jgi:hypothetical protein
LHCFQNICSELPRDCFPFYTKFSLDNEKIQSEKANNGQVKAIKITEILELEQVPMLAQALQIFLGKENLIKMG